MRFAAARMVFTVAAFAVVCGAGVAEAGSSFRDCRDCPEMVRVPAGRFVMGSPDDEPGRSANEGPRHMVAIPRFALAAHDVTRGQWRAFAVATHRPPGGGCAWATLGGGPLPDPAANWDHVGFPQDDAHPVVCVTWADAQDYVRWLSAKTRRSYRLPSEAEWEYAARAGAETAFPWGATPSHEQANYGAEGCCSGLAEGRDRWVATSPVGAFPANRFGLFDMSGNVLQWVQDCLYPYAAAGPGPAAGHVPRGEGRADAAAHETPGPLAASAVARGLMVGRDACTFRMLRGGNWGDPPAMIRSAYRNYAPPRGATLADYRSAGVGFRVARDLP